METMSKCLLLEYLYLVLFLWKIPCLMHDNSGIDFFYGCFMWLAQICVYHSLDQTFPFSELVCSKDVDLHLCLKKTSPNPDFYYFSLQNSLFLNFDPVFLPGKYKWSFISRLKHKTWYWEKLIFNLYKTSVKSPYIIFLFFKTWRSAFI